MSESCQRHKEEHERSMTMIVATAIVVPVCVLFVGMTSCSINDDNQQAAVEIAKAEARRVALEKGASPMEVRCMEAAATDPVCVVQAGNKDSGGNR
jgi:hypothetical protein